MRGHTTAWNHEKRHGIALGLADAAPDEDDDDDAAPDDDDDNMVDRGDERLPQPHRPVGPSPTTLVARETLGLISSHRITQTGAICINAVYTKHFGPQLPDDMKFG
jgi:hypothetical protein